MNQDTAQQTRDLAAKLRLQGRDDDADRIERELDANCAGHGLLFAMREAGETVLTAIEAIDPATQAMIEELRPSLEIHLGMPLDHSGEA